MLKIIASYICSLYLYDPCGSTSIQSSKVETFGIFVFLRQSLISRKLDLSSETQRI